MGVGVRRGELTQSFWARREVVISCGAVQAPKLLMQSGIGPADHLRFFGIPVLRDLSAVGRNPDDHLMFGYVAGVRSVEMPPQLCPRPLPSGVLPGPAVPGLLHVPYPGAGAHPRPQVVPDVRGTMNSSELPH